MRKRLTSLFVGNTLASLGITMIIKSGLGCFALTAANMALANWFNITIGTTGMILETIMVLIATYKGEGIGLTSIVNAFYGSIMIDVFNALLPANPLMVLGLLIIPVGWALMGKAGYGDTGSNILMNSLIKSTCKSITLIRGIEEAVLLLIGILGARECVTWFTIFLTFALGSILQVVYKFIKYDPTSIEHTFIIKRK